MTIEQIERMAPQGLPANVEVLSRLLAERYSCRAYKSEPVPRETISKMLEIAQMSASWCNSQPWQVVVTEGGGTEGFRQKLYSHALKSAQTAAGLAPKSDFEFPRAYTGIYKERQREVGWQLYKSVGIGMIPQAALANYAPLMREHFNIPDNRVFVLGCSFGWPDESHPANSFRSRRAKLENTVQWVSG